MKTIALIDYTIGGHRTAFMRLFTKACLELNINVVCCYPNTKEIKEWIDVNLQTPPRAIYVDFINEININIKSNQLKNVFSKLYYWRYCTNFFKSIEKKHAIKIDFVYFNWIDCQMTRFIEPHILDIIFPYKWSGLYFHPILFRKNEQFLEKEISFKDLDSIFLAKNCTAVTIHDEGILQKYQNRVGKNVILFPEIADNTPPNSMLPFTQEIKQKAKERTIVGIIGLEPYKGVLSLIKIALEADAKKFFFVFCGLFNESYLNFLTPEEKNIFINFKENIPENCIWKTGSLQEGEEYNSVFCSFDIIYIMYRNFYSSSNRLTKAAIFNKLVLGNNYGCVGDDIPNYNLGEVAEEDNIKEQIIKLDELREKIITNDLPYEQWKIYSEKHSTDRLKEKFHELLKLV